MICFRLNLEVKREKKFSILKLISHFLVTIKLINWLWAKNSDKTNIPRSTDGWVLQQCEENSRFSRGQQQIQETAVGETIKTDGGFKSDFKKGHRWTQEKPPVGTKESKGYRKISQGQDQKRTTIQEGLKVYSGDAQRALTRSQTGERQWAIQNDERIEEEKRPLKETEERIEDFFEKGRRRLRKVG